MTDAELLIVPMKNLSDLAKRKENRENVLLKYDKTRISIGHQHSRRFETKEVLTVHRSRMINI